MFPRPIVTSSEDNVRPIFITGVPRCGSSWVGETLSGYTDVRYVYEPLNLDWVPELRGHLSHFTYLSAQAEVSPLVQQIANRAFRGLQGTRQLKRAAYRGYWRAATRSASRVIVKDPTTPLMAEWIAKQFDAKVLIIIRHPCGFASSLEKLDWKIRADFLLRQKALMRDYLGCYEDILRRAIGDKWLNRGVFWAAIHKVISQQVDTHQEWLICKYEELCKNPVGQFSALAQKLGLEANGHALDKPRLKSTKTDMDPGSTQRNSSVMPNIWQQRMSPEQVDAVMGVVGEFGLDYYAE